MKILGSTVVMGSQHSLDKHSVRQETLQLWIGARTAREAPAAAQTARPPDQPKSDELRLSPEAKALVSPASGVSVTVAPEVFGLSPSDRMLITILEKVLGIKIEIPDPLLEQVERAKEESALDDLRQAIAGLNSTSAMPDAIGWGFIYERRESYAESETLSFTVRGLVNTADGKEIAVKIDFNLSREFVSETNLTIRAGDARAVDPLVINYDGPAADLTGSSFTFDIDVDGNFEEIPGLSPGSGFLALDKDGDGQVRDGSELFGPTSGDGFKELRSLDADSNNWLDEADPGFHRLRIWVRDGQGRNSLFTLAQKEIGAIFLGSVNAPFSVKDQSNALKAQNRQMGFYLKESGTAGTIQQLDLVPKART